MEVADARMNDLDRIGATFDLLPIPAALVISADGDVSIQMANRPFRQAGLGSASGASPLISLIATRITKFVQSDSLREDFPWQFGDAVDCRYYQVTLARLTRNADGRCLVTLIDQTSELRTEHNLRREMMTDSLTAKRA